MTGASQGRQRERVPHERARHGARPSISSSLGYIAVKSYVKRPRVWRD